MVQPAATRSGTTPISSSPESQERPRLKAPGEHNVMARVWERIAARFGTGVAKRCDELRRYPGAVTRGASICSARDARWRRSAAGPSNHCHTTRVVLPKAASWLLAPTQENVISCRPDRADSAAGREAGIGSAKARTQTPIRSCGSFRYRKGQRAAATVCEGGTCVRARDPARAATATIPAVLLRHRLTAPCRDAPPLSPNYRRLHEFFVNIHGGSPRCLRNQ